MRAAALIYGPQSQHLDHLGPLSQLLGIPLLLTDDEVFHQAEHFYPAIDAHLHTPLDLAPALLQDHDALFSCLPKVLVDELFFFSQHALSKKILPIWCPHGNSDKGHKSGFMNFLRDEIAALAYGEKMLDFFRKCAVLEHLRAYVVTGNYREADYRIHRDFYDRLAIEHIRRKLPEGSKTFLFAPTWQDSENSSSFNDACELLIKKLPKHANLIIKLHPNTLAQEEWKIEKLMDTYQSNPHILFLHRYPHIYSLLSLCDVYIGDASSIGYDFLTFDRPMVFLNQQRLDTKDPSAYLFRCGIVVEPSDYARIYSLIHEVEPHDHKLFSPARKELYTHTFGAQKSPDQLKSEIQAMIDKLLPDLEFM